MNDILDQNDISVSFCNQQYPANIEILEEQRQTHGNEEEMQQCDAAMMSSGSQACQDQVIRTSKLSVLSLSAVPDCEEK